MGTQANDGVFELVEINGGNVAVVIFMAVVLFAVSFIFRGAVSGMANILSAQSVAAALGALRK